MTCMHMLYKHTPSSTYACIYRYLEKSVEHGNGDRLAS